ncbi:phosphotransferase [Candidatus Leptofilum sp.]|uniref:phosphotransferase n=1 Tax=Candidatus Leptofilum sp. TaxID=3241576 RepID=UPI003B59E1F9
MPKILEIPTTAEEITAVWLTNALKSTWIIGAETAVTSVTKTRIGEDEGFTGGTLHCCQLTYNTPTEKAPDSLIAKLAPTDPELRAAFKGSNRREVCFYTELAAQSNLPVPHCYFGAFDSETGATILLLQDLGYYRMVEFATGCKPQDAQYAVQALATIHAQFWDDPRAQNLSGADGLDEFPMAELWSQYPQIVAELLPEIVIPPQFFAVGDMTVKNMDFLLNQLAEVAPITCVHRDCHVDNILFGVNEGDAPALILDWQSVGKGRGAYDIAYFLITSVPTEQRRQIEQTLLHDYHARLRQLGVKDYSFEQCWFDYRLAAIGKLVGTIIATVLLDNSPPFKRSWRRTDLQRLLAFFADHKIEALLASFLDAGNKDSD